MHPVPLAEIGSGGDIDDQPALLEPQVPHRRTDPRPNQAVGAVAAQHVVGVDDVLLVVGAVGERDPDAVLPVVGDVRDFGVAAQFRVWVALEVGAQNASKSGWSNMLACGKPWTLQAVSRRNSASTPIVLSSSRRPRAGREIAANSSAMPRRATMRQISSSMCTARGWGYTGTSDPVRGSRCRTGPAG